MGGQPFRVLLLRRLRLPLLLSSRTCRCGRQLDSLGHHRTTSPEAGVPGWRSLLGDGLTSFRGAQLAIDTTLVSALRGDGTARPSVGSSQARAKGAEPAWLSWLRRSAADGRPRVPNSLSPYPTLRRSSRGRVAAACLRQ